MKTHIAHEAFYLDAVELLKKHSEHLSAREMLAIASNLVGKIVAMQDQRTTTPTQAMDIVAKNIEIGNKHVIGELTNFQGRTQ